LHKGTRTPLEFGPGSRLPRAQCSDPNASNGRIPATATDPPDYDSDWRPTQHDDPTAETDSDPTPESHSARATCTYLYPPSEPESEHNITLN
jgi:hypothetical protein